MNFIRAYKRLRSDHLLHMGFFEAAYFLATAPLKGSNNKEIVKDIRTYCVFIGQPRSGHSLVGALIDAHPNAIISNELNALRYIKEGLGKEQIYSLILRKSSAFAEKGRQGPDYSYAVPNQWHGRYKKLLVIGDKKGAGSSNLFRTDPNLLDKLRKLIDGEIKFIHVVRNPYDNITTMARRSKIALDVSISRYFRRCTSIAATKERIDASDLFEVRHESVMTDPRGSVVNLCHFLGLEAPEDYVKDCTSIIYATPHKSRYKIQWTDELIEHVKTKMKEFEFLDGYSYEE